VVGWWGGAVRWCHAPQGGALYVRA